LITAKKNEDRFSHAFEQVQVIAPIEQQHTGNSALQVVLPASHQHPLNVDGRRVSRHGAEVGELDHGSLFRLSMIACVSAHAPRLREILANLCHRPVGLKLNVLTSIQRFPNIIPHGEQ
jgi:hypothetical protein